MKNNLPRYQGPDWAIIVKRLIDQSPFNVADLSEITGMSEKYLLDMKNEKTSLTIINSGVNLLQVYKETISTTLPVFGEHNP